MTSSSTVTCENLSLHAALDESGTSVFHRAFVAFVIILLHHIRNTYLAWILATLASATLTKQFDKICFLNSTL